MSKGTATAQQPSAKPGRRPSRARVLVDRSVVFTLFLAALVMAGYPLAAMFVNDRNAYEAAQSLTHTQREAVAADPAAAQEALAVARAYNEALPEVMLLDPIYGQEAPNSAEYQEYLSTMGGADRAMGTLSIPEISSSMPIHHGTSEEVLDKGVGHMFGTHLPVGGEGTHSVLSAHRGLGTLTAFDDLPELELGDMFFVEVLGEKLAYEVVDTNVVLPNELDLVRPQEGRDLVTLVTCTPYAINTHRLLVTGERVPWEDVPAAEQARAEAPPFSWSPPPGSWIRLGAVALAALVLVALVARWTTIDVIRPTVRRLRGSSSPRAPSTPVRALPKELTMGTLSSLPTTPGGAR